MRAATKRKPKLSVVASTTKVHKTVNLTVEAVEMLDNLATKNGLSSSGYIETMIRERSKAK